MNVQHQEWLNLRIFDVKNIKEKPKDHTGPMATLKGEYTIKPLLEVSIWFQFCFKLRETTSESFQMLKQDFEEDALSQSRTFGWFARFKAGRTSVKDDLHTGRPLLIRNPENSLKIKSLIKENPRITIRELSEDLYIFLEHAKLS
ncbi:hypothetical protein LAZ67_23001510 [Cordylochernes scorpioides]|uniref:Mos1 transposase HTH domain-containing protein n=1 Tax=Cordylochernes scorpioides TaxID=51811 RepID=A0ABY6LRT7_9ARAC|nr:hypothetical protein LAZ67_23001510 [Cordylochernes scorpioides]